MRQGEAISVWSFLLQYVYCRDEMGIDVARTVAMQYKDNFVILLNQNDQNQTNRR